MRTRTIILFLLSAIIIVMAQNDVYGFLSSPRFQSVNDTVDVDTRQILNSVETGVKGTSNEKDSVVLDSLHKAIEAHNKAVDDSLRRDSIQKAKKNGIEAPVNYTAEDSIVYDAVSGIIYTVRPTSTTRI